MKKTCMNCVYFHGCLSDEGSNYHIHNYCDQLGRSIGNIFKSPLNKDLEVVSGFIDYFPLCDDIETGDAYCYLFEATNPTYNEEYFKKNKETNRETLKKCINMLLSDSEVLNEEKDWYLSLKEKYDL